jgi:hypothetical protein
MRKSWFGWGMEGPAFWLLLTVFLGFQNIQRDRIKMQVLFYLCSPAVTFSKFDVELGAMRISLGQPCVAAEICQKGKCSRFTPVVAAAPTTNHQA